MKTLKINYFLFLAFFLAISGFGHLQAATLTVTSPIDGDPGSFRNTVMSASAGDVILFDAATDGVTQMLTMGEIVIDKALAITGNGVGVTIISGGTTTRILQIMLSPVEISAITFKNGFTAGSGGGIFISGATVTISNAAINNCVAGGNAATEGGGAIFNDGGVLNVRDAVISNNTASGTAGSGGGIFNSTDGSLDVFRSTISGNTAMRAGGGVEDNSGATSSIKFTRARVVGNSTAASPGNGGGLHITGAGDSFIEDSNFSNNTASAEGGGLWNGTGSMLIESTTIKNNSASGAGADQGGGGVFNAGGSVRIRGGEISGNMATGAAGSGGGILNDTGGNLSVYQGAMITNNTAVRAGGGIEDNSGAMTTISLEDVSLNMNATASLPGNGGGLHITGAGNAIIIRGTVNGNTASLEGGGLWNGAGTMDVRGTTINGNTASGDDLTDGGGGIFNNGGLLKVRDAVITNNVADGTAGSGGGILNLTNGSLDVFRSTISGNTAVRSGGGVEDNSGATSSIKFKQATVTGNSTGASPGNGGGLHITGAGDSFIENSNFSNNSASAEGGGLWNGTGNMLVENTTINGNSASGVGSDQGGGGVFNAGGSVRIRAGEISGNMATGAAGSGGGILNDAGGSLSVYQGTMITNNTAVRAGGGIEDNSGAMTTISLEDVSLNMNATASSPGNGGGLHITGAGNATILRGTVNGNTASLEGGGLWNGSGTMNVSGTTISGNTASGDDLTDGGGGIFNNGGILNVKDAVITNNVADGAAGSGGGILNLTNGSLDVFRSTISGNTAVRAGGGVEDNSGATSSIAFRQATVTGNSTGASPGNGGGLHITGAGDSFIENSNFSNNSASAEGGGLWNGTGNMLIEFTTINGNTASGVGADQGGGGVFNAGGSVSIRAGEISGNMATGAAGSGGGILNDADGSLSVYKGTMITNNTAVRAGGGIEDNSGAMTTISLVDVSLNMNATASSPGNGGGLHITGAGNATILRGTVNGNTASLEGGGLWNGSGAMDITNTTINGNTASGAASDDGGGGVFNNGGSVDIIRATISNNVADGLMGSGAGVHNNAGNIFITSSTISGNTAATGGGGGIANNDGVMDVSRTTITMNTAGAGGGFAQANASTTTFDNTIVAGNTGLVTSPDVASVSATLMSNGYNLIGIDDVLGSFATVAVTGDQVGNILTPIDPNLGLLIDNGGLTFTHAIMCPSPAVDAGEPGLNALDQRKSGVFNGTRDIGSFELQVICPEPFTGTPGQEGDFGVAFDLSGNSSLESVLYPNPATNGQTTLMIPADYDENATLRILSLSGQQLMVRNKVSGSQSLDLAELPRGTYIVQLISADVIENHRLVVGK